jgi:membrane-bound lytic murein transglycosylase D
MEQPKTTIYFKILSVSTLVIAIALVLKLFVYSADKHSTHEINRKSDPLFYHAIAFKTPDNLEFANEKVPTERNDVRESVDRELIVNAYWHSQTLLFFKRANRYFPVIEPILKSEGVPDDFKYLALIESGFLQTAVSPAGAAGIWQIMKDTGKKYGLEVDAEVDERFHIEKSTVAACKYLKEAYARFGSWSTAAASYNAGVAGITRQQNTQQVQNYYDLRFGEETGRYLFRAIAIKEILNNAEKYGYFLTPDDLYAPFETTEVEVKGSIPSLAEFAKQHGTTFKQLKIHNTWLRESALTNKMNKTYKIKIPTK